jgi:cephalosporin hydroxylase
MITPEDVQEWLKGKDLRRADTTTDRYPYWCKHLDKYRGLFHSILEIGSFEGQSALFWLNFFPDSHVTCIDWFKGSREHQNPEAQTWFVNIEDRFDANTIEFNGRLRKMSSMSVPALHQLQAEHMAFDLIYIDGNHDRDAVMVDTCLTWPMLNSGGVLIWDDYEYDQPAPHNPKPAVDHFLDMHAGEFEEVHDFGRQKCVIKKVAS